MHDAQPDSMLLSPSSLIELVRNALTACGTREPAATSVARALCAAQADGLANHGIARAPSFCDSVAAGKIDGTATPSVSQPKPGIVDVDANNGFAHPAIEAGSARLIESARSQGVAAMHIRRAYSAHVIGYHTEQMARGGVFAIGFANSPASIAPPGGKRGILGTNPISFAMPAADGSIIVVDQAASVIAKSEIVDRSAAGEDIPLGWALDANGRPTTSAADALKGTMVPAGGYKGFNLALLVELLAGVMTNSALGVEAPPFADMKSGPMNLGQTFIALDIAPAAAAKLDTLIDAITTEGGRMPGARRLQRRAESEEKGIRLPKALHEKMLSYMSRNPEPAQG